MNGEYRKIHKVLGATNKNKDLRNQVKEQVDERIENQLTIGMNLTINPVSFPLIHIFSIEIPTRPRKGDALNLQGRLQGRY